MTPERLECGYCGKRTMTLNPHPDAGKPEHLLTVGSVWVCIPCMTKSRHDWAKQAVELKELCSSQQERIKELERDITLTQFSLAKPAFVHSNILTGKIALTKAQAIHIAGLPADIEERIKEMRELLTEIASGHILVTAELSARIQEALKAP